VVGVADQDEEADSLEDLEMVLKLDYILLVVEEVDTVAVVSVVDLAVVDQEVHNLGDMKIVGGILVDVADADLEGFVGGIVEDNSHTDYVNR